MSSRQMIVAGKSVLRKFLHSQKEELSKAPVLVVSSAISPHNPSNSTAAFDAAVDTACGKVKFHTSMELGLRTVESHVTSAFPTVDQVHSTLELMQRTGASSIIGVGSGAGMDLTKAILKEKDSDATGILVPSTYGAILASTSQHALLLDTSEEALVADKKKDTTSSEQENGTTVVIEENGISNIYKRDAAFACLGIAVDAIYRQQEENDNILLKDVTNAITNDNAQDLTKALCKAGKTLNYGLIGSDVRSSPLALASSLIPPCFPNAPIMTFMASLAPGIVQVMGNNGIDAKELVDCNDEIPSLASLMVHSDGAQSVETLMSHVKANQALWECLDVPNDVLEAILHHSLNR